MPPNIISSGSVDGGQDQFDNMPWTELLNRFANAAFKAKKRVYDKLDEEERPATAADVLLPPMNATEIAAIEDKLGGPLPTNSRRWLLSPGASKVAVILQEVGSVSITLIENGLKCT